MAGGELVYGYGQEIAKWVADQIPHMSRGFGPADAIGVVANGRLIAGVVFHDFQPEFGTIQSSMVAISPLWARPHNIKAILAYPFYQLGCFKVWTCTPIDNESALKVNRHLGFKKEAILAHQFGRKRHGVICRLLKPDYDRLYGEVNGQVQRFGSAAA